MIKHIQAIVCSYSGENIAPEILHSKTQKREVKTARQIIMYLTKQEDPKTTQQSIADYFGKHHSTVINAIKIINNLIDTEPVFARKMDNYKKRLNLHKEIFSRIDVSKLLLNELKTKIDDCSSELITLKDQYIKLKIDINFLNNIHM